MNPFQQRQPQVGVPSPIRDTRLRQIGGIESSIVQPKDIGCECANIEEHDLSEVARLLDLPEGTVKSRLFLARQRLKELLQ